jgi:hypothetical protein
LFGGNAFAPFDTKLFHTPYLNTPLATTQNTEYHPKPPKEQENIGFPASDGIPRFAEERTNLAHCALHIPDCCL